MDKDLIMQKLLEMTENIGMIKVNQDHLKDNFVEVKSDIKNVSEKVDTIDEKLNIVDKKVIILDEKMKYVSDKIGILENRKGVIGHVGQFIKDNPKTCVAILIIALAAFGINVSPLLAMLPNL